MKKPNKIKKPSLSINARNLFRRGKSMEERVSDAISVVPRITNETLTDHREDVLSSARKYIYPLQHSKHKVVRISISIFLLVLIAFLVFCGLDLYKFQGTSGFIYDVTKIIPFPVAKTGGSWVSYESYLFELRRNMHYYSSQQAANFSTKDGKSQLSRLKKQSLNYAIDQSVVNNLAQQNHVTVSDQQVNDQVQLLREENRLGSSDRVFREVLSEYYGWSESDFKRELKDELLQQAVVAKLDSQATAKANAALRQLHGGADFGKLAAQVSDDPQTKGNGGQYPAAVTIDDPQIPPVITNALFKMQPGQISGIVNTGYSLDILKVIDKSGGSLHAAHIQVNLNSINYYIKPIEQKQKTHTYIKV